MAKPFEQLLQEQFGALMFQVAALTAENEKLREAAKAQEPKDGKAEGPPPLLHKVN